MQYQFNQAALIAGHSFKLGVHEVPLEVEKHYYFLAMVKDGLITEADAPALVQESSLERSKRLYEKLTKPKVSESPKEEKPEDEVKSAGKKKKG